MVAIVAGEVDDQLRFAAEIAAIFNAVEIVAAEVREEQEILDVQPCIAATADDDLAKGRGYTLDKRRVGVDMIRHQVLQGRKPTRLQQLHPDLGGAKRIG